MTFAQVDLGISKSAKIQKRRILRFFFNCKSCALQIDAVVQDVGVLIFDLQKILFETECNQGRSQTPDFRGAG